MRKSVVVVLLGTLPPNPFVFELQGVQRPHAAGADKPGWHGASGRKSPSATGRRGFESRRGDFQQPDSPADLVNRDVVMGVLRGIGEQAEDMGKYFVKT